MTKIKIYLTLLYTLFITISKSQPTGYINILSNPSFELGSTPSLCDHGMADNLITDWTCIPSYGYNIANGLTQCFPYNTKLYVPLFDKNTSSCFQCFGAINYKSHNVPNTYFGFRNTPTSNNNRMVAIGVGQILNTNPQTNLPWRSGATGKLNTSLNANCQYVVKLKASLCTEIYNCSNGNLGGVKTVDFLNNNPYTKLVIVLRKDNDCSKFKEFHTGIHINSANWTEIEYPLTICSEDISVGYNRIEFRLEDYPEKSFLINGTSHSKFARHAFIDDVGVYARAYTTPNITLTNYNLMTNTNWNNTVSAQINGTLTLNANLTIVGSYLSMGANSKIVVKSGKTLSIQSNATLESICDMWQGIVVEDGGIIIINGSNIHDAKTAVSITGINTSFNINSSTFKRFFIGIDLNNTSTSGNKILSNNFDGREMAKTCAKPLPNTKGISVKNHDVNSVFIGSITAGLNRFYNLYYGIYNEMCQLFINYCRFDDCYYGIYTRDCINNEQIDVSYSCQFYNNKYGIRIIGGNPIINIYGNCNFTGNTTAIDIASCRGAFINIGNLYNTGANTFTKNNTSIKLSNNGLNSTNGVTQYNITENTITNSPNGTGILLQESSKGSTPVFSKINIYKNSIFNIGTGIKSTNLLGFNDIWIKNTDCQYYNTASSTNSTSRINENNISYNPALNPSFNGIYNENCKGIDITKNTIYSNIAYNWQNNGASLQDCEGTLIQENTFNRNGIGLHLQNNMLKSNYLCNNFISNINGFDLLTHVLRDKTNPLHGKITTPNNLSRDNFHSGSASYGADIYFTNSITTNNKWLFQNKPSATFRIKMNGVINNSIVDPRPAVLDCDKNKVSTGGNGINWLGSSDSLSAHELFMEQYYKEAYLKEFEPNNAGSVNPTISAIISCENLINQGLYNNAKSIITNLSTTNIFESNYKKALSILLSTHPTDSTEIELDMALIDSLKTFAKLNVQEAGPGAYLARAMIQIATGEDIRDPKDYSATIHGKIQFLAGCTDSLSGIPIALVDSLGHIINESITLTDNGGGFVIYPGLIGYLNNNQTYSFIIPHVSKYSVANTSYKSLNQWISMNNGLTINLVNINIHQTVIPSQLYRTELFKTTNDGNNYIASTEIRNGQKDIAISKGNKWKKYYNSYSNYDDSAIAIDTDSFGNIYVTGFVQDSLVKNCIIIKYNPSGVQQWTRIYKDPSGLSTVGRGIVIQNGIIYVKCVNSNNISNNLMYDICQEEYIEYAEIGDGIEHIVTNQNIESKKKIFEVYPNPSNGNIIVVKHIEVESEFKVYDINGIVVFRGRLMTGENTFNTNLNSGMYIYHIINKDGNQDIGKLMIVK